MIVQYLCNPHPREQETEVICDFLSHECHRFMNVHPNAFIEHVPHRDPSSVSDT